MFDFDPEQYKPRGKYRKNRTDPGYDEARRKCLARDKKCKMCGSKKSLQVHHIIEYSKASSLRTEVSNLITLCFPCHKKIKGKEHSYVEYFRSLIK